MITNNLSFSLSVVFLLKQCKSPEEIRRRSIARKLCASERSLVRKLKKEGFSYQELVDAIRKDRCMKLMRKGITASTELTRLLCFSDNTYIYRVFRRWTGVSFVEAKRKLAQNPSDFVTIFHSNNELVDIMMQQTPETVRMATISGEKLMRELTIQETEEVAGGVGPAGAAFGAVTGGAIYLGGAVSTGRFSWGGFGAAVGSGAAAGFFTGGVSALAWYAAPRAGFYAAAAFGMASGI